MSYIVRIATDGRTPPRGAPAGRWDRTVHRSARAASSAAPSTFRNGLETGVQRPARSLTREISLSERNRLNRSSSRSNVIERCRTLPPSRPSSPRGPGRRGDQCHQRAHRPERAGPALGASGPEIGASGSAHVSHHRRHRVPRARRRHRGGRTRPCGGPADATSPRNRCSRGSRSSPERKSRTGPTSPWASCGS